MLFMVIEHFRPGRAPDVYRRFRDKGRMAPDDVRYVSSWVDRVNNRIFATLHGDLKFGMVNLTPAQQTTFVHDYPETFAPESGAWGRAGCTSVRLSAIEAEVLGEAMTLAWRNTVAKGSAKKTTRPSRKRA